MASFQGGSSSTDPFAKFAMFDSAFQNSVDTMKAGQEKDKKLAAKLKELNAKKPANQAEAANLQKETITATGERAANSEQVKQAQANVQNIYYLNKSKQDEALEAMSLLEGQQVKAEQEIMSKH